MPLVGCVSRFSLSVYNSHHHLQTSSRVPVPITRLSYRDVAMSSVPPLAPRRMLTFKRSTPITDNLAVTQTLEAAPTRSDATTHKQGAAGTELTQKLSARLGKVCVGGFLGIIFLSYSL